MKTINEINKLIIDTTKPVCLAKALFNALRDTSSLVFVFSAPDTVVDIKKIPVMGTINKRISNINNICVEKSLFVISFLRCATYK